MKKLFFLGSVLPFAALISCGTPAAEEDSALSPRLGVWHICASDTAYAADLYVAPGRIQFFEDGMDAFGFDSPLVMDGDSGTFDVEGIDEKGSFVFNPADSTLSLFIKGALDDGSDFSLKVGNRDKATIVYYWISDNRPVYADSTFSQVAATPEKFETFPIAGLSADWYEVALPGGVSGYVKREDFYPTFNHIPDAWLTKTYTLDMPDGVGAQHASLFRKGDVMGVEIDCVFADGRAAQSYFYAGKIDGNRILVDSSTIDADLFHELDITKFDKLDEPFTMQLLMHYDQPMLVKDTEIYSLNFDI